MSAPVWSTGYKPIKEFKNGAYVTFGRDAGGLWAVLLRDPAGNVTDKVRCDTYRDALAYQRAFCAIAKSL